MKVFVAILASIFAFEFNLAGIEKFSEACSEREFLEDCQIFEAPFHEYIAGIEEYHSEIFSHKSVYSHEITAKAWEAVSPYLLPQGHPLKTRLDKICKKRRILRDVLSLENAGFVIIHRQVNRGLIVAKHPSMPGHLIKLYLDTSSRREWSLWALRARGAKVIQDLLDKYNYNSFMKVPKKWIYVVPQKDRPKASLTIFPKDFILVVRDMQICSSEVTAEKFNEMTVPHLTALHTVISEGGLSDSHIGNVPFSIDNRIAFIDTEYVNVWPVHFDWLTKYFSPENQVYWNDLGTVEQ